MRTLDLSRIFSSHRLTQNYSKHVANQKQQLSGNAGILLHQRSQWQHYLYKCFSLAFLREGAPLYRISYVASSCQKHSLRDTRSQEPFQNLEFIAFCICLLLSLCKCGHPLPNRLLFNIIQKHSGFGASVLWLGVHGNHTQKQLWFPTPSVNEFRPLSREPRANY